ncbi:CAMK family protein kinase [Planoprotostelium fungivorum]|uniref:CAMK family protein kinase n=1 Tax=Planoprotostelium fungivorum TaxID=1890364 RepID=A0A2P6N3L5_9EUKA|nr:CAMK family protein kinase [Planoprotostelium fungivorum]
MRGTMIRALFEESEGSAVMTILLLLKCSDFKEISTASCGTISSAHRHATDTMLAAKIVQNTRRIAVPSQVRRPLHTTRTMKLSHDPETNNPNKTGQKQRTDAEKEKTLKNQHVDTIPEHKGWNEAVASNSEAVIKAERSSDKSVEELQKQTVETVQKKHGNVLHHPPIASSFCNRCWCKIATGSEQFGVDPRSLDYFTFQRKNRTEDMCRIEPSVTSSLLINASFLGSGSQGKILLIEGDEERCSVVKMIPKRRSNKRAATEIIAGLLLKTVKGVAHLQSYTQDDNHYYITMDHIPGCDLLQLLEDRSYEGISERLARRIIVQVVSTLIRIHACKVYHKDIKLENIMWNPTTKEATLIDFGLCYINGEPTCNDICGSLPYAAPEMKARVSNFSAAAVDVWSLGVVFYSLVYGHYPFQRDDLSSSSYLEFPADTDVPPETIDVIEKMLEPNPKERITPHEILSHPAFSRWRTSTSISSSATHKHHDDASR